jgi:hypothetical protein
MFLSTKGEPIECLDYLLRKNAFRSLEYIPIKDNPLGVLIIKEKTI